MAGVAAVGVLLISLVIGAEYAAPGVMHACARAAGAVAYSTTHQLPARLELAATDAGEL